MSRVLFIVGLGLFLSLSVVAEELPTNGPTADTEVSAEPTCEPPSQRSAAFRCAEGVFTSVRAIFWDLPRGMYNAIFPGNPPENENDQSTPRNFVERCNSDPEIKRGMLITIEPLLSEEELQRFLSFGCESLEGRIRRREQTLLRQVRYHLDLQRDVERELQNGDHDEDRRFYLEQLLQDSQLNSEQELFYSRFTARQELEAQVRQQRAELFNEGVNHLLSCSQWRDYVEGVCGVIGGGGVIGGVVKGARVARSVYAAGTAANAAMRTRLAQLGLTNLQAGNVLSRLDAAQVDELVELLTTVRAGTPLNLQQSQRYGDLLNEAQVRGFFAVHRTTEEGAQGIVADGAFRANALNHRVYAFPFVTSGSQVARSGVNLGNSTITFQGQAANLFSNQTVFGPFSGVQRALSHQTTGIGRLVIDEGQWVDDVYVVTRAHMESLPPGQAIMGAARDTIDVGTGLSYIGAITIGGYGDFQIVMREGQ